ncbi:MAG TPA: 3',5'-cyclic-nucleotide phosphodiesterase, partial [Cyclobacteriaceae bacterium]|nr:3',5'-cyclic-nucleotide phosphodiesterase [Cyclobacteriaceae bacterium]
MNYFLFAFVLAGFSAYAQPAFQVVPLGVKGGVDESNLSAYALAASGTQDYVCLDAGTLHTGIRAAIKKKVWKGDATAFLRKHVKGYLISHPHYDHANGLITNSPDDSAKYIYGIESCLSVLKEKHFSWKSWANFGNEGEAPTLNKYTYQTLVPGKEVPLHNTPLFVTPFVLSHVSPTESTAFLVRSGDSYLLYLGDTGCDRLEKSDKLMQLWTAIAPLIQTKKLKAVFIEVSFANEQPDNSLFGHLTPNLLREELSVLEKLTGAGQLKNLNVVITHMKP